MIEEIGTRLEAKKPSFFRKNRWWIYPTVAFHCLIAVVAIFVFMGVHNREAIGNSQRAAEYGDSFGYVNALFSGLALAGVVLALLVQVLEFHLAEEERLDGLKSQKQIANQTAFAAKSQMIESLITINNRLETGVKLKANPSMRDNQFVFSRLITSCDERDLAIELRSDLGFLQSEVAAIYGESTNKSRQICLLVEEFYITILELLAEEKSAALEQGLTPEKVGLRIERRSEYINRVNRSLEAIPEVAGSPKRNVEKFMKHLQEQLQLVDAFVEIDNREAASNTLDSNMESLNKEVGRMIKAGFERLGIKVTYTHR